jgi:hypothetical protein
MILNPRTNDDGTPKLGANGQPAMQCYFAVAFLKGDAAFEAIRQQAIQIAQAAFPQLVGADGSAPASFAWKIIDGDSTDKNRRGKRPCDKEGFPGHYVMRFTSGFLPKCINQELQPLTDDKSIKRGDYVRVSLTIKDNRPAQTAGLYVSPNMVQFCGYGGAIQSGPDPEAVFGAVPIGQLPPGCTQTPQAPPQGMPAPAATNAAPAPTPTPQVTPPAPAVGANVQPAHDLVAGPPPAPPAPTPAAPETRVYNGHAYPRTMLEQQGWTAAQIDALPLG